jgi:VWFA-related protein
LKHPALNLTLLLAAVALLAGPARGQVAVSLSAVDKAGRPVEGLRAEDLRVTVGGAEQKVVSLTPRAEEPLRVVLMLDASASQEQVLRFARPAAMDLMRALLRPGRDEAAVVSFTNEAEVVEGLTADLAALGRAVQAVEFVPPPGYVGGGIVILGRPPKGGPPPPGSTAIWDSLAEVCDGVLAPAKDGRRVVVLFSDGVDTSSRLKPDAAAERLVREGVTVYSVGIGDSKNFEGVVKDGLRKLSKRTGGRAYFPKKVDDLVRTLGEIRAELLASYAVALAPAAPRAVGETPRLRVEVVNPELRRRGVELAHPQTLSAGPPPP